MYEIARIAPFRVKTGEKGNSRVPDRCVRRSAEALTSYYLLREGVELRFESPLRHRIKVQIKGHFGRVPEWPIFFPRPIIARLSRVAFLQPLEDDVQAGGDGSVSVSSRMLVAATGSGVGMAEAGHQLALGGAGPSRQGASGVAKVMEVQFVVSHLVAGPAPVLVEGRSRE